LKRSLNLKLSSLDRALKTGLNYPAVVQLQQDYVQAANLAELHRHLLSGIVENHYAPDSLAAHLVVIGCVNHTDLCQSVFVRNDPLGCLRSVQRYILHEIVYEHYRGPLRGFLDEDRNTSVLVDVVVLSIEQYSSLLCRAYRRFGPMLISLNFLQALYDNPPQCAGEWLLYQHIFQSAKQYRDLLIVQDWLNTCRATAQRRSLLANQLRTSKNILDHTIALERLIAFEGAQALAWFGQADCPYSTDKYGLYVTWSILARQPALKNQALAALDSLLLTATGRENVLHNLAFWPAVSDIDSWAGLSAVQEAALHIQQACAGTEQVSACADTLSALGLAGQVA
jgi:hypothetical protein